MDSFRVSAADTAVLAPSHLVEEMKQELSSIDGSFPVLIGDSVTQFHDIDGGYNRDERFHVVNLIHRVQGDGSPRRDIYSTNVELHLSDHFYNLSVEDVWKMTETDDGMAADAEYPDGDFVLSMKVTEHSRGKQTFREALQADIDKREQEFSQDNVK